MRRTISRGSKSSKSLLLPLFVAAAFAGGAATTLLGSSRAEATSRDASPYTAMAQLGRVLVEVENSYVEPVDRAKLLNGAIKGMVAELDPHSAYMPAEDYSLFQNDTEGKFAGVGVEVDARGETLTVIAPIEGSPAERAGIKSGDHILTIDGADAVGQGLDKLVRKMRGHPGTHVKLMVKRAGVAQPLMFDLVREIIRVPSVAAKMLEGGVAYVRIKQFQEHTHDELLAAAARLRTMATQSKKPIVGVVLDLRANPGGLVDEAAEVADEFLSSGTIYTTRHRGEILDEVKAKGGGAFSDVPIVALVNEYSASASELVAGALQDHKRALIVGNHTFGKGSVQAIIALPGGAGLRLTIARYYTPSGHAIQADGVHPDIVIETTRVATQGYPTVRERDLEGALPAEGPPQHDAEKDAGAPVPNVAGDAGAAAAVIEPDVMRSDARNVPSDPMKGSDFVLRMGWQIVRGSLSGRGPKVR
jgi:carboxyl-terminal processing protease